MFKHWCIVIVVSFTYKEKGTFGDDRIVEKMSYTDVLPVTHPAYGQMLQMASSKFGALESILFTVFGSSPYSFF